MAQRAIPPGTRCLSPKKSWQKFDHKKSWFWDKVKNDPTFPKPIYLGPRSPVFLEHELDEWLGAQAGSSRECGGGGAKREGGDA